MRTQKLSSRKLFRGLAIAGVFPLLFLTMPLAQGLPPGGASPDTPDTWSSVSPNVVEQCGSLDFEVHGFPAGEIVNLKFDDGQGYDQSVQGTGVIATQRIGSDGSARGTVTVPCDMAVGDHWIRYLASAEQTDSEGRVIGTIGFSNRGNSDFTVTAPASNSATTTGGTGTGTGTTGRTTDSANTANNQRGATSGPRTVVVEADGDTVQGSGASRANTNNSVRSNASSSGAQGNQTQQNSSNTATNSGAAKTGDSKVAASGLGFGVDKHPGEDASAVDGSSEMTTATANGSSAPFIGLFVGSAILIVGMSLLGIWVVLERTKR